MTERTGEGAATESLRERVRAFVDAEVIPHERDGLAHDTPGLDALFRELRPKARAAGIFLPQLGPDLGGLGLPWREASVALEESGRSLLGPRALNVAAPDEGNLHTLHQLCTPAQRERYLVPLARGDVRSCFAMTEPAPGAGSDPSLLRTRAERRGNGWVISGRKWFITGADGAAFSIALVQTDDGPTMFMVDADNPGMRVVRQIGTMDAFSPGGHCEVVFDGCEVDADAVLGEIGKGLEHAQLRLGPARLTHCMRWLGVAVRSMEIATGYARERDSFGTKLAGHQMIQAMVADSYVDIHASRLMIRDAAGVLDDGGHVKHVTSMAKVFVSEAVGRVVDRAVQICGGLGIAEDVPLSHFYRECRPFRIYDGANEVHRMSLARRIFGRRLRP